MTSAWFLVQVLDIKDGGEDVQAMLWQYKDVPSQHWKCPNVWEKHGNKQ